MIRNLRYLVRESSVSTPPKEMTVVVNGPAVGFLLASAPEAHTLAKMVDAGVTIHVCSNSFTQFGHGQNAITEAVSVVSSGVAEVVRTQKQDTQSLKSP